MAKKKKPVRSRSSRKKPKFNAYEERILRVLARGRRALTTLQIADFTGISYNTVKKYLESLSRRSVIKRKKLTNKIYWYV